MALTHDGLLAYIAGLYADGVMSEQDFNQVVLYILANGNLSNSPRDLIQIRRGNVANLPELAQGELGFCLDEQRLYIGGSSGNVALPNSTDINNLKPITESVIFYVDGTNGNDTTGTGASDKPFKTIKKAIDSIKNHTLLGSVKIRVLAGDYTAEGNIEIRWFYGWGFTITAFDGTNDILTVSDNYKINSIDFYGTVGAIQGLKAIPASTDYAYGFFVSNGFVTVSGCSFDKAGQTNSMFGCSGNSYVWIDSCKCSNALNVLSVNYGAKAVLSNWISGSINNQNGYKVHNGGVVFESDTTRPAYTTNKYLLEPSSQVFDSNGISNSTVSSNHLFVYVANIGTAENVTIPLNFQRAPSWLKVSACVNGTKIISEGGWSSTNPGNLQSCVASNFNGDMGGAFALISFQTGASDNVSYNVGTITANSLTLVRTGAGTPTGSAYISIICGI